MQDGKLVETPFGPCFRRECTFDASYRHGDLPIGDAAAPVPARLEKTLERLGMDAATLGSALFLDTETTGLAGGTGTLVFLVGLGYFEDTTFRLHQFFMRTPSEERAFLWAVGRLASSFESVVTFNGKAFDLPLLETRYALARQPLAVAPSHHLDLLFVSRRVWRARLASCSLAALETEVLGHRRDLDVPSSLIPQIYFRYVIEGDPLPMREVFSHNAHDVLSLVALSAQLRSLLCRRRAPEDVPAEDTVGVGRLLEYSGLLEESLEWYEGALRQELASCLRADVLARTGFLHKRLGRQQEAATAWQQLAAMPGRGSLVACVELAKHLEHREKDYGRALSVVNRAMALVELWGEVYDSALVGRKVLDLRRRYARLARKMSSTARYSNDRITHWR